jgi:UDP-N-acetylglucosamine 2-epimerase
MNKINKIVLSMGTRAEIIKMAPLYHALKEAGANPVVWHVGQHEELAWPFYEFFRIKPELHLLINRKKPTLGHLSSVIMDELDSALIDNQISCMLVHGDTSTAFIAALTSFYYKIPIAHIEAGLRTYEMYDPFPEEKNRQLISRLASWHFAPTQRAKNNLLNEGILESSIHTFGNTVVDAALWGVNRLKEMQQPISKQDSTQDSFPFQLYQENLNSRRLIVVTAHRRENWDVGIESITSSIRRAVEENKDIFVVWPVHPNPLIKKAILKVINSMSRKDRQRILLTEPVSYSVMIMLLKNAWLVMTDSGGIQEEAITLGVPVLVLRDTTERPEVIDAGGGVVIGVEQENMLKWLDTLSNDIELYESMKNCSNPFGDGEASIKITKVLLESLNTQGA